MGRDLKEYKISILGRNNFSFQTLLLFVSGFALYRFMVPHVEFILISYLNLHHGRKDFWEFS